MASKLEKEHDKVDMNVYAEGDLSVQPLEARVVVPVVDGIVEEVVESAKSSSQSVGPSIEAASSSPESSLLSDRDTEIVSDKPTLNSPFCSPKSPTTDGMSDTTLEDGEIRENRLVLDDTLDTSEEVVGAVENEHRDSWDGDTLDECGGEAPNATIAKDAIATSHGVTPASDDVPDNLNNHDEVGTMERMDVSKDDQETTHSIDPATNAEDDIAITDGEETDVETVGPSQYTHSVPPHKRPGLESQVTRQNGIQASKSPNRATHVPSCADIPRAPRTYQAHNSYQTYRSDGARGELARMGAQLMKLRNELDAERKKSANMRKSVEEEKEKVMDAALSMMTTELLNKQVKMLKHQAKVEAKERDLQFREARIEQLEVYLSEGQKQVYRESIEDEGGLTMAEVNREHDRRQAELQAKKSIEAMEGKLAIRLQGLQLREAAQQMREQQYKALMRSSFEADLKQKTAQEIDVKVNEAADIEYNNGFGAGKTAGRAEAETEARQQGFLEGYSACHRVEALLSKVRQGLVSRDSPELDFLYDSAHPQNPFTVGTRIGEWQLKQGQGHVKSMTEKVVPRREPVVEKKPEVPVNQKQPEESVRNFASELRGAQNMHNGHFVLANGPGPSSPATTPKSNGVNGDNGNRAGRSSENVYEGRRILKYEEVEEDNLIDLF